MKRLLLLTLCSIFLIISADAQIKKLLTTVNSIKTKEVIELKYNSQNQLIYFDEKGTVTYREFSLKYDKASNQLSECTINNDKGELVLNSKYTYGTAGYITEEVKSSGKKLQGKSTEQNKIYIDSKGRLTKTAFDDGKLWEEFEYDKNNNITKYTLHSAFGDSDIVTTHKYNKDKSVFANIENLPAWFWALHMNNVKWCGDFVGKNNPNEAVSVDPRFGTDTVEITYQYDADGYPVKQLYNGKVVKEFTYKIIK